MVELLLAKQTPRQIVNCQGLLLNEFVCKSYFEQKKWSWSGQYSQKLNCEEVAVRFSTVWCG